MMTKIAGLAAVTALGLAAAVPAQAQSAAEFYKGRQMSMIISTGPGGGYDINGRLIARHMPRHLPGAPTIVARNMPGAGHVRAANFMAVQAPKDGSHVATIAQSFVLHQVIDGKGAEYDAAKFAWLGSSEVTNSTIYVWSATGVKSLDDAKKQEVLLGATGVGSGTTQYPALLNNILGTKFRIVPGYGTGGEINLAMERGEVHGRAGNNFNSVAATNGDWLRDKKITFLVQIGLEKEKNYPDVPMFTEFGRNDTEKQILKLFAAVVDIGRPLLTTPGVPQDRVDLLRKAFNDTMKDEEFLAEAKKAKLDIAPTDGLKLQKIVADIIATPKSVVDAANAAADDKGMVKDSVAKEGGEAKPE
ncbi:MAG TPA: tripartite tricarboxylate transporter substrate-binding protein [Alphaproteobacteria bacterium]|nr:tripartite tricarboxylate transporter substrate-binding protein [Alphaproteobacteria bacterium]